MENWWGDKTGAVRAWMNVEQFCREKRKGNANNDRRPHTRRRWRSRTWQPERRFSQRTMCFDEGFRTYVEDESGLTCGRHLVGAWWLSRMPQGALGRILLPRERPRAPYFPITGLLIATGQYVCSDIWSTVITREWCKGLGGHWNAGFQVAAIRLEINPPQAILHWPAKSFRPKLSILRQHYIYNWWAGPLADSIGYYPTLAI